LNPPRNAIVFRYVERAYQENDTATQARYQPVVAPAARLLPTARAQRMMIAYASADHRADNATTAHTVRDADSGMRAIDPNQPPVYKPIIAGETGRRR